MSFPFFKELSDLPSAWRNRSDAFLTYESARPWAKEMKEAVLTRYMPPWFADPAVGHFSNVRKLNDSDIRTIADWADSGALDGDAKDKPAPLGWSEGWDIKPD